MYTVECTILQYLWLVNIMIGLDCSVLYNPAVPVTGTQKDGSRLYSPAVPVTGIHYDWSKLHSTVLPCCTVTGTQYDVLKLDYCTILQYLWLVHAMMGQDCTVLYNLQYLWLVHIMTGLDCTVLYNPAVSVTSTHYVGSRLYMYCTTLQYLWLLDNMMALDCTTYMYCTNLQYLWLVHPMMGLNWITVQYWSWINGVQWIHLRNLEIYLK